MSARRPIYKKAVDVFTLVLVGLYAVSMTMLPFHVEGWQFRLVGAAFAIGAIGWFVRLVLAVRYLWTGRAEPRVRDVVRRRARRASPSPG